MSIWGTLLPQFTKGRKLLEAEGQVQTQQQTESLKTTWRCPYHPGLVFTTLRGIKDHMKISHRNEPHTPMLK